ncbi:hypothetical protein NL676_020641 [Syzygium grande]|nr:hypothetical protein NL676_020641 [Syzygium grande]
MSVVCTAHDKYGCANSLGYCPSYGLIKIQGSSNDLRSERSCSRAAICRNLRPRLIKDKQTHNGGHGELKKTKCTLAVQWKLRAAAKCNAPSLAYSKFQAKQVKLTFDVNLGKKVRARTVFLHLPVDGTRCTEQTEV